jgi:ribose transport system ATP-binding protein
VSLRLERGEVLAVVGENGAGKSTLMKILGGVYTADAGSLFLDGNEIHPTDVADAQALGIVLIHQELNLADQLDVAANVFLGHEPTSGGPLRVLDRRIYPDAEAIIRPLGLDCSPRMRVADLSIGQQQLVEIARALALRSRVIIMDEPTSSLTQRETERLFEVIRGLKRDGIAILYISHRMKEIETIADRVTVLRDGRNAGELAQAEISHEAMVRLMVGRELKQFFQRTAHEVVKEHAPSPLPPSLEGRGVLDVRGLRWLSREQPPIDFTLKGGEIVGMAGLMGAGRTELAETLFGLRPVLSGEIHLHGQHVSIHSPVDAVRHGVFLVPEDRRLAGLVLPASVKDNISLPSLDRLNWLRLVAGRREAELARDMCTKLNVRTPHVRQIVGLLSGGNQQKVVLAKWLCRQPRLLILDEPTRGVDVGAKTEIYALMDQLAKEGMAILMISSDLEEVLGMSDRVLVMHEGRLAGELPRAALSEEAVMRLATGGEAA